MAEDERLTSSDALRQIVCEIKELKDEHEAAKSVSKDIANAFSLSSSFPWPYVLISFGVIIALFASTTLFGSSHGCALLLFLILITNGSLSVWDVRKKTGEVLARLQWCIDNLKDVYENSSYPDCLALDQFSELLRHCETTAILSSPSHSVSYVYRKHTCKDDETPTAIPTALLATGDLIILWPGQQAPALLQCAEDNCFRLGRGEIFEQSHSDTCSAGRNDAENIHSHKFRVLESPIVSEIKQFLSSVKGNEPKTQQEVPPTVFERQRAVLLIWFLKFIIPSMLIAVYVTSILRYFFLPNPNSPSYNFTNTMTIQNETAELYISNTMTFDSMWCIYYLQTPALVCAPLLPLLLPGLTIILLTIGEAKTEAVCKMKQPKHDKYLTTPTTLTMSSQGIFFRNEGLHKMNWRKLLHKLLLNEDGTIFHRNAGLFIPLGSLTALCCIDKEGILSWFNPITEKVFFFKNNPHKEVVKVDDEPTNKDSFECPMPPVLEESEEQSNGKSSDEMETTVPGLEDQKVLSETMSLSQDSQDPSRVRFDDVNWSDHLPSLKPIGLNIILNMCSCTSDEKVYYSSNDSSRNNIMKILNQKKTEHGDVEDCNTDFPHEQALRSIAFSSDCLPPGMRFARKGLCSLAEIMGFSQSIKLTYSQKKKFTVYRKPFCPAMNRLSTSFEQNSSFYGENIGSVIKRNKWKQYLPHVQGTVLEDFFGDKQILVYGTGDLITEHCSEIWDSKEIQSMTIQDRRKALDFYQRSSVAGQCIAFAYMPLLAQKLSVNEPKVESGLLVNLSKAAEKKRLIESLSDAEVFNNMIFLGMTTLQHQARFSVCQMVDTLDRACIRFVYFSSDNEVRSRVFAEKMGLETGWNCHISLSACPNGSATSQEGKHAHNRSESSKSRSSSEGGNKYKNILEEADDGDEFGSPSSQLIERLSPRTQSESSTADSLFNVSNRAKLPRGIKNIVPHIESVDNVPLLVPLFTDSTPETSGQMIQIMQNYGEVVCCIGSSDCMRNMSVFHQANVSLAFEPIIQPLMSDQRSQDNASDYEGLGLQGKKYSSVDCIAMETARKLHCFPCSLLLSGDSGLSVIASMITQARHFLFVLRIFFVFLIKCEMTLSLFLLVSHVLLLPSPLTPLDVFWLSVIAFPLLSLSLLGSPPDHDLMTWANQKVLPSENPITGFMVRQAAKRYSVKFLPSLVVLVTFYTLALHSCCIDFKNMLKTNEYSSENSTKIMPNSNSTFNVQCYPYFLITVSQTSPENQSSPFINVPLWKATNQLQLKFRAVQLIISGFLFLYLCIVSIGYVHRWKKITDSSPCSNKVWSITVPILILCHILGIAIVLLSSDYGGGSMLNFGHSKVAKFYDQHGILDFGEYQEFVWVVLIVWALPCLLFNELWKRREIKMWNRSQKRARLDFGTKLGMNSPF